MIQFSMVRFWPLLLVSCVSGELLRAGVIVSTSISLTHLTITPSAGSIQFVSPLISPPGCAMPSLCATAFAQGLDSQGGFMQKFNVADNGATSASVSTTLANANAAASAPKMTESGSDGVNINSISASASSTAQGTLYGTFQIVGTTSPVTISFAATLTGSQTLSTDAYGLSASSEVIFSLLLDNGDIPLFYDNPLTIGPNSSPPPFSFSFPLTGSSSSILPGTAISMVFQADAESSGLNSIPEPSSFILLSSAAGLSGLICAGRRWRLVHRRRQVTNLTCLL